MWNISTSASSDTTSSGTENTSETSRAGAGISSRTSAPHICSTSGISGISGTGSGSQDKGGIQDKGGGGEDGKDTARAGVWMGMRHSSRRERAGVGVEPLRRRCFLFAFASH